MNVATIRRSFLHTRAIEDVTFPTIHKLEQPLPSITVGYNHLFPSVRRLPNIFDLLNCSTCLLHCKSTFPCHF